MLDLRLLRYWPITSWQDQQGACSAHTGTPEVHALFPSHAGGSSHLYEGFLLIPPQSTLKARRAVCPVIHPAPPLYPWSPGLEFKQKCLVHSQKCALGFAGSRIHLFL